MEPKDYRILPICRLVKHLLRIHLLSLHLHSVALPLAIPLIAYRNLASLGRAGNNRCVSSCRQMWRICIANVPPFEGIPVLRGRPIKAKREMGSFSQLLLQQV
jgi:hypothetical protein